MDECYDGNVERIEKALLAANEKLLKLEQALAEKDLFLAQANRHKEELFAKLTEKDQAYQQLMVQAITLAEIVLQGHRHRVKTLRNASIILADKLLNSPEAQAFLKEREGT